MDPTTAHIPNWQDIQQKLAKRSAEEILFDAVGGAVMEYAKAKVQEDQHWKAAYDVEKAKNDYLIELLEQNGIKIPDFSKGIPPLEIKKSKKEEKTFVDLLQTEDAGGILAKLHSKIDGHGGKDVALLLHRAKSNSYISRFPTEKEFKSEFPKSTGAWRSISHYLNPNTPVDYSSVTI